MARETQHTRNADDSPLRSTTSRRTVLRGTLTGALAIGTPALAGRAAAHGNDEEQDDDHSDHDHGDESDSGEGNGDDDHSHDDGSGNGGDDSDDSDESDDEGGFASVTFDDQTSNGTSIVVDSVTMPEGGFISIHDERFVADDDTVAVGPGSIVGFSRYLDPGTHTNVGVELFDDSRLDTSPYENDRLDDGTTLIALPHKDTNDNEVWDFYPGATGEDGAYKEGPQSDDDVPLNRITDTAEITVPDDGTGDENESSEDDHDDGDSDDSDGSDGDSHDEDGHDHDDHSHDDRSDDDGDGSDGDGHDHGS
jgi:hypothetical protein